MPKAEAVVKQEPGVPPVPTAPLAVPSGPDKKPVIPAKTAPVTKRQYKGSSQANRQPVVPKVEPLSDEDDGLTCRLCLASYWYKTEMFEHYKTVHSIADPEKQIAELSQASIRRPEQLRRSEGTVSPTPALYRRRVVHRCRLRGLTPLR